MNLFEPIKYGRVEVVRELLAAGLSSEGHPYTDAELAQNFVLACFYRQLEMMVFFLDKVTFQPPLYRTMIRHSLLMGNIEVARLLQDRYFPEELFSESFLLALVQGNFLTTDYLYGRAKGQGHFLPIPHFDYYLSLAEKSDNQEMVYWLYSVKDEL